MRALVGSEGSTGSVPGDKISNVGEAARRKRHSFQIVGANDASADGARGVRGFGCNRGRIPLHVDAFRGRRRFHGDRNIADSGDGDGDIRLGRRESGRVTVMRYAPGGRSSRRNSPRSSLTASRCIGEPTTAQRCWRRKFARRSRPAPCRAESLADFARAER